MFEKINKKMSLYNMIFIYVIIVQRTFYDIFSRLLLLLYVIEIQEQDY